jgi:hypothetical protein
VARSKDSSGLFHEETGALIIDMMCNKSFVPRIHSMSWDLSLYHESWNIDAIAINSVVNSPLFTFKAAKLKSLQDDVFEALPEFMQVQTRKAGLE